MSIDRSAPTPAIGQRIVVVVCECSFVVFVNVLFYRDRSKVRVLFLQPTLSIFPFSTLRTLCTRSVGPHRYLLSGAMVFHNYYHNGTSKQTDCMRDVLKVTYDRTFNWTSHQARAIQLSVIQFLKQKLRRNLCQKSQFISVLSDNRQPQQEIKSACHK